MTARRGVLRTAAAAVALQWQVSPLQTLVLLALSIGGGLLATAIAWTSKLVLDGLAGGESTGRLLALALAAVMLATTSEVGNHVMRYVGVRLSMAIGMAVDRRLFATIIEQPGIAQLEDPGFHTTLRMAQQGSHMAPQQLAGMAQSVLRAAVTVVSMLVVLIAVWPPMALLLAVSSSVGIAAQIVRSRAALGELPLQTTRERWRDHYRSLLVDPRAAKEIRLFELGRFLFDRMIGIARTHDAVELSLERKTLALHLKLAVVSALATAAGSLVVIRGAARGELAIGDVILFMAAVAAIQSSIGGVLTQLGSAGTMVAIFRSYLAIVERPSPAPARRSELAPPESQLELRDVWFRYADDAPWVLRGVDLVVPRGSAVGLVGVNGAGKSTLIKLLTRLYEPTRGAILWDGIDIRELDPAVLRARMTATFQDFMNYELTARDNIALGDLAHLHDIPRIRAAARSAGIDDRLAALPAGYGTFLSRTLDAPDDAPGALLSGGEWQRVALARSLLRSDADVLILDEPNANLDAEAEHEIHRTLVHHAAGRTRVLVSHRLSTLRDADVIAVLGEGRIVEQGTHDQLMHRRGVYARLFSIQAAGYQDHRVAAS